MTFDDNGTTYKTPDTDEIDPDMSSPATKAYALPESKPTNAIRNTNGALTSPDRTSDTNSDTDESDKIPHHDDDDDDNGDSASKRLVDDALCTSDNGANDHTKLPPSIDDTFKLD